MLISIRCLFATLCVLATMLPFAAHAGGARHLAATEEWRKLLHYEADDYSAGLARSYVNDPRFFLSPEGSTNPAAELEATLSGWSQPVLGDNNTHPRCRFVARYRWLQTQAVLDAAVTPITCPDYTDWRSQIQADSLVLVYASAHLNSPSSMYGHTLLRIDPPADVGAGARWLSWGVSFGANIPKNDNTMVYAWKGIAGGYPGLFNVQPYFEKIEQYSKMENRDLWEYPLNLSRVELERLVEHLWELKDINFAYFFFDENCAYRLLELLEYARPTVQLTSRFSGTTIPVDTVRVIRDAGLINATQFHPSAETVLQAQMKSLSGTEKELADDLMRGKTAIEDPAVLALAPARRYAVYDMAYRALRYRERKAARDPLLAARSLALLRSINKLADDGKTAQPVRPTAPEEGHKTAMVALRGGVASHQLGNAHTHRSFADAELRLSFHDLLDPASGYLRGAAIDMGRFVVRQYEGGDMQLQQFDVVDIQSITPSNRFYHPWSWQARLGAERVLTEQDDRLVPFGGAGFGYSVWLIEDVLGYARVNGRLEYNPDFVDNIQAGAGVSSGLLWYNRLGTAGFSWEQLEFFNGDDRHQYSLAQDVVLTPDVSLRMAYTRQTAASTDGNEVSIALRYFY
jgi:hypothetical protein